nr:hypothetical protein [uncultured Acetatifactor sp.]
MRLLTVIFLLLLGCILTNSQLGLSYAAMGLNLWFEKMIPSLLPFMMLSGIMVRMKLTDRAAMLIYPVVKPLAKVRKNVCYAMLMGFLCGFPMGARVVDDLYQRQMISKREAEYLLAFCNNIGPVYFCSFVLPLLGRRLVWPYLFGMYGIPLLYGLALRYTRFHDIPLPGEEGGRPAALVACEDRRGLTEKGSGARFWEKLLEAVDGSVQASVRSMLSLGGYMILFNLLNLVPHLLFGRPLAPLSPLLEITGGLKLLGDAFPLYSLLALSFGGLSCIAQTYSCIGDSDLSISDYILHKVVLTLLCGLFYLGWFLLLPGSFLR